MGLCTSENKVVRNQENLVNRNENKEINLEVKYKIQLDKEKDEIFKVYELSDNRIAVELDKSIKIYSLKTYQLITELNHDKIDNSIELKNKDIAITDYNIVYFYKLSGDNYINYQKFELEDEEIFEIYELKNENLILCPRRCLKIYKRVRGQYTILSYFKLSETVGKILEIKTNTLFLFLKSRTDSYATANYQPYYLELINTENKETRVLDGGSFYYWDFDKTVYYSCDLLLKNNKYLFARYADAFSIYDIESDDIKQVECIYVVRRGKMNEYFPLDEVCFSDYDDDSFIILSSRGIYKYDEKTNQIVLKQKIKNEFEEMTGIIKLKNNNFIIHNKNEILFINN
jgi:hypothetical protein